MTASRAVLAIAHRAPADAERARQLAGAGVSLFELDVQLRGGEVVVSHWLPLPGPLGLVQRDNWRLRLAPGRDLPLADAVALLPPDVEVLLDPKHHAGFDPVDLVAAVGRAVPALGGADRFVVSTGDAGALAGYRELGLRTWVSVGDRAALARLLRGGAVEGASVRHTLLDAESIAALRPLTGIIAAWTVNRVGRAQVLVEQGVGAITSDRTAVLACAAGCARLPGADG